MLSLFCANFILFSFLVIVVVHEMYDIEFLNKGEKTMIQLNHVYGINLLFFRYVDGPLQVSEAQGFSIQMIMTFWLRS